MVSDFVKGRSQYDYPASVQAGIRLHRQIDAFTDAHAATQAAKVFFRPQYRLYAGAFVDVVYDHFLANDTAAFETEVQLEQFAQQTYARLSQYKLHLPERFSAMLPYMQQQNWLANYRFREGIAKSFGGLVRRAAYLTESEAAFAVFNAHYTELHHCYQHFFPELKKYTIYQLQELLKK